MKSIKTVVLLHGFGETSEIWDIIKPYFSFEYQYITLDYSRISFCQTIEEYADWLYSEIEQLKIQRFVLIGHSMGGYIALAFAEKYKPYLAGLGLFHSSAFADSDERKDTRLKTITFIEKHGSAEFIADFLPKMYADGFRKKNEVYIQKQLADNQLLPAKALIVATEAMRIRPDRTAILKNFDEPILMIIGMKDKFISYQASLKQLSFPKNPYIFILAHVAHAGMIEAPEVCAAAINMFLVQCLE